MELWKEMEETEVGNRDEILKDKLRHCFDNLTVDVLKLPRDEFVEWLIKDLKERWGDDEEEAKLSRCVFKRPAEKDIIDPQSRNN